MDPDAISKPSPAVEALPALSPLTLRERARFPWMLFAVLLLLRLSAAAYLNQRYGLTKAFLILGVFEISCGAWVAFDALQRGVPKAFRWGLGSALLWVLVFPWYLTRRRQPQAVCPFIEAEVGPVTRTIFFALVVFFLISFFAYIIKGPPPG
ncbi:MAG: hypothetical protein ACE145_05600 [Terriglobia bacterium]